MNRYLIFVALLLAVMSGSALAHEANERASIAIAQPVDGATVKNPVQLQFVTERIDIEAVGVRRHKTGHVLLLINTGVPDLEEPIPMDARHVHFVEGEEQVTVDLPEGENRLQVMLLDEEHILFEDWLVSEPVTVFVTAK